MSRVDSAGEGGPSLLGDRSLHNDVYAAIVEWIHRGELRPGDRISEAAIARRLGISRAPVREAISRLDHEGLLTRRPRRGPVVPELSRKDLDDVSSVRQLIEGYAARSACQRIRPEDVEELESLIAEMRNRAEAGRWTETALLNARFHETVVRVADNRVLTKIWQILHPLAWLLANAPSGTPKKQSDPEDVVRRHRVLLDALVAGDPDRAEEAFRHHIREASQSPMHQAARQEDKRDGVDGHAPTVGTPKRPRVRRAEPLASG